MDAGKKQRGSYQIKYTTFWVSKKTLFSKLSKFGLVDLKTVMTVMSYFKA